MTGEPNIYKYSSIDNFLSDYISYLVVEKQLSYRTIAKICQINSSSYVQKILNGSRKLSVETGKKIAKGLKFDKYAAKYFLTLIKLNHATTHASRDTCIQDLLATARNAVTQKISDVTIYSHWIYGVILEVLHIKGIHTEAHVAQRLSGITTKKEIHEALQFLIKRKYIIEKDNSISLASSFTFETYDDKQRIIDVQKNHLQFLSLAKHRIIDNLSEREYQNLVIALPKVKFKEIKESIRNYIHELNDTFSNDPHADQLYVVQCCAFRIDKNESSS